MKKSLFVLAVLFYLIPNTSFATHIMGSELSLLQQSTNTYEVTLYLYRDCYGIPAQSIESIFYTSADTSQPFTDFVTLNRVAVNTLATTCGDTINTCNSNDPNALPGVEQHLYRGLITLPFQGEWIFSWDDCCRNAAITNVVNPSGQSFYTETIVDNSLLTGNSTPVFVTPLTPYVYVGANVIYNMGAYDLDGDSLAYKLVDPRESAGPLGVIAFNPGFSATQPLATTGPFNFDPATGAMSFVPSMAQSSIISVEVQEFRAGALISTMRRDLQFVVINPGTFFNPDLPTVSGINGTGVDTIIFCVGDTVSFMVYGDDPDSLENVTLLNTNSNTFFSADSAYGKPAVTTVSGIAGPASINGGRPNVVILTAYDDNCLLGRATSRAFYLQVVNCDTADVWPGETNGDKVVDPLDILPIGIASGQTGPARPSASNNWVPQAAAPWKRNFLSNQDYRHADCNGDGTIDGTDLIAVNQNLGNSHLKSNGWGPLENGVVGDPTLTVEYPQNTLVGGETVRMAISYGDFQTYQDDLYGLAVRLGMDMDNIVPGSIQLHYNNTVLGTMGTDLASEQQIDQDIAMAMTRMDGANWITIGTLFELEFTLADPLVNTNDLTISFDNVRMNNANEDALEFFASDRTFELVRNYRPQMIDTSICLGSDAFGYTQSGIYIDTLLTPTADIVRMLDLTVRDAVTHTVKESICTGESYAGYTTAGIYTDNYPLGNGCDSTRVLSLTVTGEDVTNVAVAILPGESYYAGGAWQTEAGTYYDVFTTAGGCDSTVATALQISVGVDNSQQTVISIYPNPGTGLYQVELAGAFDIRVLDIMGKVVHQQRIDRTGTINLSAHANGVYFIHAQGETASKAYRLIKQ